MSKTEKATKVFFWGAFGAFLAMSIPHVAFIFRYYEPKNDGYSTEWWAVSYGVAIGIDLLICWLSYTRSEQASSTKADSIITWGFIFLLAGLSWFCNWLFAELVIGVNVWDTVIPFIGSTVGSVTPLIVSAIPVFMIAYTYMSKRILNSKPQSVAEMEKIRDDLKSKSALEKEIKQLQKVNAGPGLIQIAKEKVLEVKKAASEVLENQAKFDDEKQETSPEFEAENEPEAVEPTPEIQPKSRDTGPLVKPDDKDTEEIEIVTQANQERQYTKYTPLQAAGLQICRKNNITTSAIRSAIKAGKIKANSEGKVSRNAVESWVKSSKKSEGIAA